MLGSWFKGAEEPQPMDPNDSSGVAGSVLSQWNAYANSKPAAADLEMGGTSSSSDSAGGGTMQALINVAKAGVGRVASAGSSVKNSVSEQANAMPSRQNLAMFGLLLCGGLAMLALAFMVFLPIIVIAPTKFALCFTLGSIMVLGAFIALRGWKQQIAHMFSADRLKFSGAYVGSLVATLYAALISQSYLQVAFFSTLQAIALLYYLFSYFPGGTSGVKYFLSMVGQGITKCGKACFSMIM